MCALFPFPLLWLRVRSFCGTLIYNTVFLWYGCARVRSVGLFALPYFNDLVKSVLSRFIFAPYTDYTHAIKSRIRSKYKVMQVNKNRPKDRRRNSAGYGASESIGEAVDLWGRKSAKYFFGAWDMKVYPTRVQNQIPKNFHDVSKIIFADFRICYAHRRVSNYNSDIFTQCRLFLIFPSLCRQASIPILLRIGLSNLP